MKRLIEIIVPYIKLIDYKVIRTIMIFDSNKFGSIDFDGPPKKIRTVKVNGKNFQTVKVN